MTETFAVSVSGAAFSLLLFENIKSQYDQDGFLLGEIITKETNKLTDADHRVLHTERIIKVKSTIPCPQQFWFYDSSGKINENKIRDLLGEQEDSVVGWFLFRRKRSNFKLALREKIIHKQIAKFFSKSDSSYFTCCVLTANNSEIRSTYSYSQTFLRYHNCKFDSLPLHIINLSDPTHISESPSQMLNDMIKVVKSSGEIEGHQIIKRVQQSLQNHMQALIKEVAEKELQLFKVEQEVQQLRYNHQAKRDFPTSQHDSDCTLENGDSFVETCEYNSADSSQNSPKKKRGRPRKSLTIPATSSTSNYSDNVSRKLN